jgi:hypothetical protein
MILLFQRTTAFRYDQYLNEHAQDAVLFTHAQDDVGDAYGEVVRIPSFDGDGRIELRVLEQHARTPFHAIVAHGEYDLIRAARLRARLGLPGQSVASAVAYRDKVRMKQLVRVQGVRTANFRVVESALDLKEAARIWGYPIVIKPIDGGGSRNVTVVRGPSALDALLAAGCPSNAMVEQFVPGDMYHVDGLARAGEIVFSCVSRYLNGCLSFQEGLSLGSTLIDPSSELSDRMKAELARAVHALPILPVLTFHAEFFLTPDNEIVFCEVAARTGGGRIVESVERAYGVNLNRTWVRWQCGLPEELRPHPFKPSGWLLVSSPTNGRLVSIPDRIPFDWTVQYWPTKKPGDTISRALSTSNVDGLATMVVRGADPAMVEQRIRELDDWFLGTLAVETEARA